jgi:hypothetical protein
MCSGCEPNAEEVIKLVCRTGGVAVLAHPWALKNPISVVKNLKASGLNAIEAYRCDGKLSGMTSLQTHLIYRICKKDLMVQTFVTLIVCMVPKMIWFQMIYVDGDIDSNATEYLLDFKDLYKYTYGTTLLYCIIFKDQSG